MVAARHVHTVRSYKGPDGGIVYFRAGRPLKGPLHLISSSNQYPAIRQQRGGMVRPRDDHSPRCYKCAAGGIIKLRGRGDRLANFYRVLLRITSRNQDAAIGQQGGSVPDTR